MVFRILLVLALFAAGVATSFFLWQLAEGPYDGIGLFFFGVALIWGLIAGALALKRRGQAVLGGLVLLPVVFPSTMYGLLILLFVVSGTTWR